MGVLGIRERWREIVESALGPVIVRNMLVKHIRSGGPGAEASTAAHKTLA